MELLQNYKVDNINKIPIKAFLLGWSDTHGVTVMNTENNTMLFIKHEDNATYTVNEFKVIPAYYINVYHSILSSYE